MNRNRPRGPLPEIHYHFDGYWTDLRTTRNDLLARVQTHVLEQEVIHG